ncbi:MAG TPA: SDR family oxidoreductase [Bryobacteraceae bacterium]|jgi:nucleoside-diphosphate-sugar epimerase|nr:SDR family oxidoreductase [Bryobacteraceae bacterium]
MKVLVIGGTLFIGRLLVEELVKAGHDVAILHRKPKHDFGRRVENLVGDRNDATSLNEALAGRRFEAVYDNVYDWERGTSAAQVEATVRACGGTRLTRYIFMSSVAAYGDGLNHKESDPLAPDYHSNPYIRHKASTERRLFRMHAQTGLPVVTFRPPFIYGSGNPFYREQFFWDRLRAGRPIIIPGDGHRLMQFVYVHDLVHAMVRALEEPRAVGEAFNIGDPKPLTQFELVEKLAKVAGVDPTLVRVPRDVIAQAGGNPMDEPYYFGEYLDMAPITENIGKVTRVLKMKLTPFDAGLKETYKWYTRNHKSRTGGFEFDDRVLALAKTGSPASV